MTVDATTRADRYSNALTLGYLAGLRGEDPDPEMSRLSERYDDGWLLGAADREQGATPKKFMGYCDKNVLPVKQGDTVTIKKGTLVRCNGVTKPAGRTYKVRVNHVQSGRNLYIEGNAFRREITPIMNPTVVWPGSGGYWAEADINDIPEAQ
jgi:hypothetical protein